MATNQDIFDLIKTIKKDQDAMRKENEEMRKENDKMNKNIAGELNGMNANLEEVWKETKEMKNKVVRIEDRLDALEIENEKKKKEENQKRKRKEEEGTTGRKTQGNQLRQDSGRPADRKPGQTRSRRSQIQIYLGQAIITGKSGAAAQNGDGSGKNQGGGRRGNFQNKSAQN